MKRASLTWSGGVPASDSFGDSYYSAEDGLAESRAVFLRGCGLPERWKGRRRFTVAETGFGTGLNFLALWDLWRREAPPGAWLNFISVEGFPMDAPAAARAHAAWPELGPLSAGLAANWPPPDPGPHHRRFDEDRIALTVIHGPVLTALETMDFQADAWFLDGFAPSQNPEMWSPELMRSVAAHSAPGARAATFTVAGAVRRGLADAGFSVEKKPGHGRKRERLEARLPGDTPADSPPPARIAIIGAGIAGAALSHALTTRGLSPIIIAEGPVASTPPRALLTPRLENADRPHARALTSAFHHAVALYATLGYMPAGALRTPRDDKDAERFKSLAMLWAGLSADADGLNAEQAGVLNPETILAALMGDTPRITRAAAALTRDGDVWRVQDPAGDIILEAETIILAAGAGTSRFAQAAPLTLQASAGQAGLHAFDGGLTAPFIGPAYLAPAGEGRVMLGATHDVWTGDAPPAPDPARQQDLLEKLKTDAPELAARVNPAPLSLWTGVRCVTPDFLPVAGRLEEGLYALTGLGSRGYAHAPLLAQMIAAEICGEPSPMEKTGQDALHPDRFEIRRKRREG